MKITGFHSIPKCSVPGHIKCQLSRRWLWSKPPCPFEIISFKIANVQFMLGECRRQCLASARCCIGLFYVGPTSKPLNRHKSNIGQCLASAGCYVFPQLNISFNAWMFVHFGESGAERLRPSVSHGDVGFWGVAGGAGEGGGHAVNAWWRPQTPARLRLVCICGRFCFLGVHVQAVQYPRHGRVTVCNKYYNIVS